MSTLSQKQFGKYLILDIFPANMGILPVLFKEISIQKHPRNKYLQLLGKFPSHDFHLIVGKFTEDTGDTGTGACPPPPIVTVGCSTHSEKFLNYMKFMVNQEKMEQLSQGAIVQNLERLVSNQQVSELVLADKFLFCPYISRKFPKGGG